MKKIGILYDNISQNTGDLAVGLSIKKILRKIKVHYTELIPGKSNPDEYDRIIIGGGLLLRKKGDFFYDKFRIRGSHILNCVGIYDHPHDLNYLEKYTYLSVRSTYDAKQLDYLKKQVSVVPCTSLLLKDLPVNLKIKHPALGIHCINADNFYEILTIINKYAGNFHIYLLPITHYNYDFDFQEKLYKLASVNKKNKIFQLPILNPLEIFTIIGKFDYFISYSLHGALFAYAHNVPFLLWNNPTDKKMIAFMNDRNLTNTFTAEQLENKLEQLLNSKNDYSKLFRKDIERINNHITILKSLL